MKGDVVMNEIIFKHNKYEMTVSIGGGNFHNQNRTKSSILFICKIKTLKTQVLAAGY